MVEINVLAPFNTRAENCLSNNTNWLLTSYQSLSHLERSRSLLDLEAKCGLGRMADGPTCVDTKFRLVNNSMKYNQKIAYWYQ
jgi:hypothetical protein